MQQVPSDQSFNNDYAPRAILIVEDSKIDIELVSHHIKKIWPTSNIITANTLVEADTYYKKHFFELVLIDLNLPDSYGAQTIQTFSKNNLGARIVAMTSLKTDSINLDAKNYGASAVISKTKLLSGDFADELLESALKIPPISLVTRQHI